MQNLIDSVFNYFDIVMKIEVIYNQGRGLLYWVSFTELLDTVLSGILLVSLNRFGLIFLFLLHIIKGIIGLCIYRAMPLTEDFILEIKKNIDK